jgi:Na+-transporting methylmalonyl-CoA/oxaloacetate decarboxylase beta subunit
MQAETLDLSTISRAEYATRWIAWIILVVLLAPISVPILGLRLLSAWQREVLSQGGPR